MRFAAAGLLGCALACGAAPERPNLLLISVDSLRADHLGSYGYGRATSPTLDRLASEGIRFANAQSPTSWTLPAHVTLLTGRAQRHHRTLRMYDQIPKTESLLAERLAERGYETAGFFSGPFLHPWYGFDRGFERYVSCQEDPVEGEPLEDSHGDRTNPAIREAFAEWLAGKSGRPFFAFVHMWDVHYDYIPPPAYAERFDSDYTGPLDGTRIEGDGFPLDAGPRDVEHLRALYDGEILYTDETVRALLDLLEARDLLATTLVVVTADHGEEFLEHGGKGHGVSLYDELARVPLILRGPGIPPGRVVETPVSLADVAPTLLELAGLGRWPGADGRSLVPLFRAEDDERFAFSARFFPGTGPPELEVAALRARDRKLVYHVEDERWEQFDLGSDPGERRPGPVDPELRAALLGYMAEIAASERVRPRSAIPDELEGQLRELGYLE